MNNFLIFAVTLALCAITNGQFGGETEFWPQSQAHMYYYERPHNYQRDFLQGAPQQHHVYQQPQPVYQPQFQSQFQPQYQPQYQPRYQPQYQPQSQYQPQYQLQNRFSQAQKTATAKLIGDRVSGYVNFTQQDTNGRVQVTGEVRGLADGPVGFHVHEKGDIVNGCGGAAGHFNPENLAHGGPNDRIRHVGDLGNIESRNNVAYINIEDHLISLSGDHNIIGRAVVVHAMIDDLGKTAHPDSKTTGNAGARLACGVIGIA